MSSVEEVAAVGEVVEEVEEAAVERERSRCEDNREDSQLPPWVS